MSQHKWTMTQSEEAGNILNHLISLSIENSVSLSTYIKMSVIPKTVNANFSGKP